MTYCHLANTQFEFELEGQASHEMRKGIGQYALCLQLQFLPLLYASLKDHILVTHLPDSPDPRLTLLDAPSPSCSSAELVFWGASPSVNHWCEAHLVPCSLPPWSVVQKVNSKAFSFSLSPPLPKARLLKSALDFEDWWAQKPSRAVLKSCFGVAGRGKVLLNPETPKSSALAFCKKEWGRQRPVLAEPWVNRDLDFSTQWEIHPDGVEYLGPTLMNNSSTGVYEGTRVGELEEQLEPYLAEHLDWAQRAVNEIRNLGYWGAVGIDAMVYDRRLHPIVEINARQTMARVALLHARKMGTPQLSLAFRKVQEGEVGLLPPSLELENGKTLIFPRNLFVDPL